MIVGLSSGPVTEKLHWLVYVMVQDTMRVSGTAEHD